MEFNRTSDVTEHPDDITGVDKDRQTTDRYLVSTQEQENEALASLTPAIVNTRDQANLSSSSSPWRSKDQRQNKQEMTSEQFREDDVSNLTHSTSSDVSAVGTTTLHQRLPPPHPPIVIPLPLKTSQWMPPLAHHPQQHFRPPYLPPAFFHPTFKRAPAHKPSFMISDILGEGRTPDRLAQDDVTPDEQMSSSGSDCDNCDVTDDVDVVNDNEDSEDFTTG